MSLFEIPGAARLRPLICSAALGFASAHAEAPIDLRVALVIGNAAYATAPLANPANDARAMGDTLKSMGFTVISAQDASKVQMQAVIAQARDALKGKNGVGMLYYAGHGLQLDWRNYMVPVDARLSVAADVPTQTVDLQNVVDAFKAAGNRMNILVLDACRDNPFAATASGKGLAQMDAPPGTLLAFATAPGNVAEDGDSKSGNGLYTQFLVRELKTPGAKIEEVFKRVRFQVRKQSEGRQVPWESTSLEDDFSFDPSVKIVKLADAERAREATASLAKENADWHAVMNSRNPDDLFAFLQKYPSGLISEQAQFRLDQLQRAKVEAQPGANGVVALASGANRYATGDRLVYDSIDGFTNVAKRVDWAVTFADNERVEINDGKLVMTQMGGVILNSSGRKDPALVSSPAELSVGKQWRTAYTNTRPDGVKSDNFYDYKVTALEDITVPAGTFRAYKIVGTGEARAPREFTTVRSNAWFDPKTMTLLRLDTFWRAGGAIAAHSSLQLVSASRVPRTATP